MDGATQLKVKHLMAAMWHAHRANLAIHIGNVLEYVKEFKKPFRFIFTTSHHGNEIEIQYTNCKGIFFLISF